MFVNGAMLNEVLYLYVDAKRKEHEYSKAVWPTRQSKIVNLIIALIAIGVALIFYTYCYNNSLSGANHQVIFSTMFAQSHFPAHITVWELLWSLVRMLLLFTSLTFPRNITLSYTDKKSTSDNSYGTR